MRLLAGLGLILVALVVVPCLMLADRFRSNPKPRKDYYGGIYE